MDPSPFLILILSLTLLKSLKMISSRFISRLTPIPYETALDGTMERWEKSVPVLVVLLIFLVKLALGERPELTTGDSGEIKGDQREQHANHASGVRRGKHHRRDRDHDDGNPPTVPIHPDRKDPHPVKGEHHERELEPESEPNRKSNRQFKPFANPGIGVDIHPGIEGQ